MTEQRPSMSGPNDWLVDEMYQEYLDDPGSVNESWRHLFEGTEAAAGSRPDADAEAFEEPAGPPPPPEPFPDQLLPPPPEPVT
ncbi:MAG: hypothetical protein OEU32_14920, partial [Acidimicrobiia bacterium]|nr:hypothetical protein [Acidimicrobiia bacterium]